MKKIHKTKLNLRQVRGATTLAQLSEATGIPTSTLNALERGFGKGYSLLLKHKVAQYFGVDVLVLFPEEREKFELIMAGAPKPKHHWLLTLYGFAQGLRFKDEAKAVTILKAMDEVDELDLLFSSGMDKGKALRIIRKFAADHGLEAPEAK